MARICVENVSKIESTPYAGGGHFVTCNGFAGCFLWSQAIFDAEQREGPAVYFRKDQYTRHEVTAVRAGRPSGRTAVSVF